MKTNKNIILTGASGSLGKKILENKLSNHKYYSIAFTNNSEQYIKCDLRIKKNIFKTLNKIKPAIIIHAAALIDINYCQKYPNQSIKINYYSTRYLSDWINKYSKNTKLIFISTDQVYGDKNKLNYEINIKTLNVYAKHKFMSEKYVKKLKNYLILRVNFVGKSKNNKKSFTDWIISSFSNQKKILLYNNIFFNPLHSSQLSKIINKLINFNINGTYNIGCNNEGSKMSKAKFAIMIAKKMNIYNNSYKIVKYNQVKTNVKRPYDLTMKINKIQKILLMPKINSVINQLINEYVK